ncbi:MAG: phosphatase PAP2 family protein [Hyphomicrobiales bacterium]|nr:phosphatase PAP2 family protein [Hyphomicrobiales bacterium]MBV8764712.1 phosphatase PAP2 family protein [Hyphomicrobiales bacterium]MBV9434387.1 phosphatase PAP2 family protein [Hyphomicrobiales bacterium]MBV9741642.1 phosphatase PAP2 family protein [Hyphomicrobiales bacterium]
MAEAEKRPDKEASHKFAFLWRGEPWFAGVLLALLLCAVLVATAFWPELDIALARPFYEGAGKGFALRSQATLVLLRELGYYLPIAVLAFTGLAFLLSRRKLRSGGALTGRRFVFLALSFALGPGLLVNGVLKEISHRPRPVQIVEFGGPSPFRPWYVTNGACEHNCSFASGEVAGAAWLVAPASLLPAPWRALALALASAVTIAVAMLRMAFGGHFASDAAAAVLVTLATILVVGHVMLRKHERVGGL